MAGLRPGSPPAAGKLPRLKNTKQQFSAQDRNLRPGPARYQSDFWWYRHAVIGGARINFAHADLRRLTMVRPIFNFFMLCHCYGITTPSSTIRWILEEVPRGDARINADPVRGSHMLPNKSTPYKSILSHVRGTVAHSQPLS